VLGLTPFWPLPTYFPGLVLVHVDVCVFRKTVAKELALPVLWSKAYERLRERYFFHNRGNRIKVTSYFNIFYTSSVCPSTLGFVFLWYFCNMRSSLLLLLSLLMLLFWFFLLNQCIYLCIYIYIYIVHTSVPSIYATTFYFTEFSLESVYANVDNTLIFRSLYLYI